jgi:DNA uptake protein ComE-like DNA-binding protein
LAGAGGRAQDINTADAALLEMLPGIGRRARADRESRQADGLARPEELVECGLPQSVFEQVLVSSPGP